MTEPQLVVEHLAKSYQVRDRAIPVIASLSFTVQPGEIVSIVGPSGIGKTTLLKCLTGLQGITSGRITLHGREVNGPPEGMALVFQEYTRSLMPWLTVEQNVLLPLKHLRLPRDEAAGRVSAALHSVGLDEARTRYPWQLSGGMQQRVAIARALAYRPDILVMDEPFASVDAQTRFDLEDLCLRIRDEFGMTILLVTHDIDESVYLSDRVVMLGERPAKVIRTLEVPLGSARNQVDTRSLPAFARLRAEILELIRHAGTPAAKEQRS
ncbi:ABC transporter ATP-binding protein [Arthrobacter woluwensis]|uniref:ABC transporter ATP-binding protein n=1 Tax=Arthrobacter woluwensis TaxID=156980 RepID=UPI0038302F99